MSDFEFIRYEVPAPKVARIVLARPEKRNAQSYHLLYELNAAFDKAAQDDAISVIILAADGSDFSSGHDLKDTRRMQAFVDFDTVGTWCGFGCAGAEGPVAVEQEVYLGLSERWRNIAKPTIAEVQGKCIAGGLMLAWPMDLIVAGESAIFRNNTIEMGVSGTEFFHEPWELGTRKAKEFMFTAMELSAAEAAQHGMVNRVVPDAELMEYTLALAERIARMQLFALKLAKGAVNAAQDRMGRKDSLAIGFAHHQLTHAHNRELFGYGIDPSFMDKLGYARASVQPGDGSEQAATEGAQA
ncbi:enoyl-CoA hydratase [Antricoccus suffuscus]|uniref:Enoyl-CoA hydratase n=1 Tax=Antricoccus suffuscus TaxID=1629062 RepID=A0A2T0ZTL4_9ACTN|nr:enoyl-CoA hydratase [Antricoccus suffuscus]PRZ39700.1 enoyl-CoA hydratase [Antricoccus suffuscus]